MEEIISYFKQKSNLVNLLFLIVLLVGIPVGVYLARNQQIFFSKAREGAVGIQLGGCAVIRNDALVAKCGQDLSLVLISPFGGPAQAATSSASPNFSPTPVGTSSASPSATLTCKPDDKKCKKEQQKKNKTKKKDKKDGKSDKKSKSDESDKGSKDKEDSGDKKDKGGEEGSLLFFNLIAKWEFSHVARETTPPWRGWRLIKNVFAEDDESDKKCDAECEEQKRSDESNENSINEEEEKDKGDSKKSKNDKNSDDETEPTASGNDENDSDAEVDTVADGTAQEVENPNRTVSFKIADTLAGLASAQVRAYTNDPMIVNFSLSDEEVGTKTIFVEFTDIDGNIEQKSITIDLVGPDPEISLIKCGTSIASKNQVSLTISGTNFGKDGVIDVEDNEADTSSWEGDVIKGTVGVDADQLEEGVVLPIRVTRDDGAEVEAKCEVGAVTALDLGAKLFCRSPKNPTETDVDLTIVQNPDEDSGGSDKPIIKKDKATIDKSNLLTGVETKFETGKSYTIFIDAPKSIRRSFTFTAGDGTNVISDFILPIGDIAPDNGDGKINALDRVQLNKEWGFSEEETKEADFNLDKAVNSIDWACMRYDFDQEDEELPVINKSSE